MIRSHNIFWSTPILFILLLALSSCSNNNEEDEFQANASDTGEADTDEDVVSSFCGDNVINLDLSERCDGEQLGGSTCAEQGFQSGTLACDSSCQFDTSDCVENPRFVCGNEVIEGEEECDGNVSDDITCATEGFTHGEVNCSEDCEYDYSECYNPSSCGDEILDEIEECDDGNNEDNDGCTADCFIELCGDGILQENEECDTLGVILLTCEDESLGVAECENCEIGDPLCESASECGNDALELGESCDDGNLENGDGCSSNCDSETCGNGIREVYEVCDGEFALLRCQDLGFSAGSVTCDDQCLLSISDCHSARCGDEVREGSEECDDGNRVSGDGCSRYCRHEFCGDETINNGETCDDGNTEANDGCSENCHIESCGDGIIQTNEMCDDLVESATCNENCTNSVCGDGVINATAGETCDDSGESETCNADCTAATCGDGVINTTDSETCDDSGESAYCNENCTEAICGDGILNTLAYEECDDGNTDDNDGCLADCTVFVGCGNGVLEGNEECDDGNPSEADDCLNNCTVWSCGDGFVNAARGEECDDENTDNSDGCLTDCTLAECGNGVIESLAGETCDDSGESADCNVNCTEAICGDGILNTLAYEECDDGNPSETDDCLNDCTVWSCGDGFVNAAQNEECDDENTDNSDGCLTDCTLAECGNGVIESLAGETCDDSGESADCNADCTAATCGDGVINTTAGEACDDGNSTDGDGCTNCLVDTCSVAGDCNDGNSCTADSCINYQCNNTVQDNGTSCSSDPCMDNQICTDSVCGNGTNRVCPESNFCVLSECNPETGSCEPTPVNNDESCNDSINCTENDVCNNGSCQGTAIVCLYPECNFCDEATGICEVDVDNEHGECSSNDDIDCTSGQCENGTCGTVNWDHNACDDNNDCTINTCTNSGCENENIDSDCDDGIGCTSDICVDGECKGTPNHSDCDDRNNCTDNICNIDTGCVTTNNTNSCDDDINCTNNDICADGECIGVADHNFCNEPGPNCKNNICDPNDGSSDSDGCVFSERNSGDVCWSPPVVELTCTTEITCTCGNGILDLSEQCDDFNTLDGDGCSRSCEIEDTCANDFSLVSDGIGMDFGWRVTPVTPSMSQSFEFSCGSSGAGDDALMIYNIPQSTYLTLSATLEDEFDSEDYILMSVFTNCADQFNSWGCSYTISNDDPVLDLGYMDAGQFIYLAIRSNRPYEEITIMVHEANLLEEYDNCNLDDPDRICSEGFGCFNDYCSTGCNPNGMCEPGEDPITCSADCFVQCGDNVCIPGEDCTTCSEDCGYCASYSNVNGCFSATNFGENCISSPNNCGSCLSAPNCGNGMCDAGETITNCPFDCFESGCGDFICESPETAENCPLDCGY